MRSLFFLLFLVFLHSFLPNSAYSGEYYNRIMKEKNIRIGFLKNSQPYSFHDAQGKLTGFEYDLAKEIAKQLNVSITVIPVNHTNRIHKVIATDIDIALANVIKPAETNKLVSFSIPYLTVKPQLLVHANSYANFSELKNMKIAVLKETTSHYLLEEIINRTEGISADSMIVSLNTEAECFTALKNHHVVAWFGYAPTLVAWKQKSEDFQLIGDFDKTDYFSVALPYDDELKITINHALRTMWKNGTYTTIYNKWFGPESKYYIPAVTSPFAD